MSRITTAITFPDSDYPDEKEAFVVVGYDYDKVFFSLSVESGGSCTVAISEKETIELLGGIKKSLLSIKQDTILSTYAINFTDKITGGTARISLRSGKKSLLILLVIDGVDDAEGDLSEENAVQLIRGLEKAVQKDKPASRRSTFFPGQPFDKRDLTTSSH